ncbi:MAG: transporter permease [Schumannella sp.]|nr:transporter permease [Schumannella sp.]
MTAVALERSAPATALSRIGRVVRLNLANPWNTVILPWIVIASIFVLSFGIWWIVFAASDRAGQAEAAQGMQYSGASSWIFFYMMVVAVQAINFTFPLALGFGSTRRDFYLGSALTFVTLSAGYAIALTILSTIETATGGWGVGGTMFTAVYFGGAGVEIWQRLIIFFCVMLFFFFVGAAVATVFVRWRATGLVLFFIAIGALLVGAIALISLTGSWAAIGQFFVTAQATGTALWLLLPTAIAAVAGWLVLRRTTPRS